MRTSTWTRFRLPLVTKQIGTICALLTVRPTFAGPACSLCLHGSAGPFIQSEQESRLPIMPPGSERDGFPARPRAESKTC